MLLGQTAPPAVLRSAVRISIQMKKNNRAARAAHIYEHFLREEIGERLETLRSRFGDLTTNGKPRFAVSGFTLAVCPYLGLKIRGLNSRLPCLFSFVRSLLF